MNLRTHVEKALERTGGEIPEALPPSLLYPTAVYARRVQTPPRLSIYKLTIALWIVVGLCVVTGLFVMHRGGWKIVLASLSWPTISIAREVYHTNEVFEPKSIWFDSTVSGFATNTWRGPTNAISTVIISNYFVPQTRSIWVTKPYTTNFFVNWAHETPNATNEIWIIGNQIWTNNNK